MFACFKRPLLDLTLSILHNLEQSHRPIQSKRDDDPSRRARRLAPRAPDARVVDARRHDDTNALLLFLARRRPLRPPRRAGDDAQARGSSSSSSSSSSSGGGGRKKRGAGGGRVATKQRRRRRRRRDVFARRPADVCLFCLRPPPAFARRQRRPVQDAQGPELGHGHVPGAFGLALGRTKIGARARVSGREAAARRSARAALSLASALAFARSPVRAPTPRPKPIIRTPRNTSPAQCQPHLDNKIKQNKTQQNKTKHNTTKHQ